MSWESIKQISIGAAGIILVLVVGFLVASPVYTLSGCEHTYSKEQCNCAMFCDNFASKMNDGSLTLYNWDKNGSCTCGAKK
jgi:hypothetical protein